MMAWGESVSSILVTCRDKARALKSYVPALQAGGWSGEVRILVPGDELDTLEGIVGLLLCGGGDIHPRHWNPEEPLHPTAEVDEARDGLELPLIRRVREAGLPILGICRGEQALNVALGGSLCQDVPSTFDCDSSLHSHGTPDEPEIRHLVSIDPSSRLHGLLGTTTIPVNSRHHQAVDRIAPGFLAVAWHLETLHQEEPLIEAIEAEDGLALGVQWHPENLVGLEGEAGRAARALFRHFAEQAEGLS
jgi:putative glutamine amidotransferase